MKLEAKSRLVADAAEDAAKRAKAQEKQRLQDQIDQAQKNIDNLKKSVPSRKNRMKVSPVKRITTQKQILQQKERIADLRLTQQRVKTRQS